MKNEDKENRVRPYLYVEQLSEVTPWSQDAIRNMVSRGVFVEGVHYFRPRGPGSRPIFSWQAVVEYIEQNARPETIRLADGTVIDLDETIHDTERLLR
jgi:hypothetical protein